MFSLRQVDQRQIQLETGVEGGIRRRHPTRGASHSHELDSACEFEFPLLGHSQPFTASMHMRIVSKVAQKAIVQLCIAYIRSDDHTGYS